MSEYAGDEDERLCEGPCTMECNQKVECRHRNGVINTMCFFCDWSTVSSDKIVFLLSLLRSLFLSTDVSKRFWKQIWISQFFLPRLTLCFLIHSQYDDFGVFLQEVQILIPDSWSDDPSYEESAGHSFSASDVRIDRSTFEGSNNINQPYTHKATACGSPGRYIRLTPEYITDDAAARPYGDRSKVIVHYGNHLFSFRLCNKCSSLRWDLRPAWMNEHYKEVDCTCFLIAVIFNQWIAMSSLWISS